MTAPLVALQTTWRGYRFRSRAEARWAVFLTAAGIEFEYEPEGYRLPSGPYLPDFRLRLWAPQFDRATPVDVYIEVKGGPPDDAAIIRAAELSGALMRDWRDHRDASNGLINRHYPEVFIATAAPAEGFPLLWVHAHAPHQVIRSETHRLVASPAGALAISSPGSGDSVQYLGYRTPQEAAARDDHYDPALAEPDWLVRALGASRSARFEFADAERTWRAPATQPTRQLQP